MKERGKCSACVDWMNQIISSKETKEITNVLKDSRRSFKLSKK